MEIKKEIITRRTFFKKAAQKVLPVLIGSSMLPSLFSCEKEEDDLFGNWDDNEGNGGNNEGNGGNNEGNDNNNEDISQPSGTISGYGYVDLGLSVNWAIFNVGASKISDAGSEFEYLSYDERDQFLRNLYLLFGVPIDSGEIVSFNGTEYDKATDRWGNKWCTPTKEQCEELIRNCEITEFDLDGVAGLKYKSKINGRSIFFPKINRNYTATSSIKLNAYASSLYIFSYKSEDVFAGGTWNDKLKIRAVVNSHTSGGCAGCNSTCSNSSTNSVCSQCGSNCSGNCKTACDYNCAATCVAHCYGSCNDTCGGSCKYISAGSNCSGCANSCSLRCYYTCSYACSTNCQSSCVNTSK